MTFGVVLIVELPQTISWDVSIAFLRGKFTVGGRLIQPREMARKSLFGERMLEFSQHNGSSMLMKTVIAELTDTGSIILATI
jgi:hypothetical protein